MKWLFILLLFANCLYLGWVVDRDARLSRQIAADVIKSPVDTPRLDMLSGLTEKPTARKSDKFDNTSSARTSNTESVLPIALNPNTGKMLGDLMTDNGEPEQGNAEQQQKANEFLALENELSGQKICYTYGPIPDDETELLSDWLDGRGIHHRQRKTSEQGQQGKQLLRLYLTPQESYVETEATYRPLQQKGVSDIRLIREGDLLNAISLGLFSNQASVNRRLNGISTKEYKVVVVPYANEKQVYWFDVTVVQNSAYINELFSGFPARFNVVPVDCNQIAMQR